jgi:predicted phosphodiesterase
MRIGLICDIHANLISLESVLADIKRDSIDQVIFLGDLVTLGPQPKEVLVRLRELGCPCIMGNHDTFVLNVDRLHEDEQHSPWYIEAAEWCAAQLSPADFDYLRSFQPWLNIPLDPQNPKANLLCFHGSPKSNTDFILSTTSSTDLDEMLTGYSALVMAGGHTHIQMIRRYRGTIIINAGSVGMPIEYLPFEGSPPTLPWAEYAIVSWFNNTLSLELRRITVNLDAIREIALASDYPHRKAWAAMWK